MQQALTAPVFKSLALAGLVLGVGIGIAGGSSPSPEVHRLSLHAVDHPDHVYLTVFRDGDILVRGGGGELRPITFKTRGKAFGCRAVGIETLVPRDERSFDYFYDEKILSCDPDAPPVYKTPRRGIVTVSD